MNIEFILTFFVFALAATGLGNLYLHLIQPLQLLSFMQRPLNWAKTHSVFLFKSIGGCKICTIQRFADLSFVFLLYVSPVWWAYWFPLYCLFGGAVFFFQSVTGGEVRPIVKSEKIDL